MPAPGAISGACAARSGRDALETRRPNDAAAAAIDARGTVFVSAGAGTGKTTVLVERFVRAVVDDGLDVDSLLVDHLHRARGRRASRADPRARCSSAGAPISPASSTAPGSRRSTASAAGCSAPTRSPPASTRGSACSTSRRRACCRARRSTRALERFCAADEPDRWQLLATYGAAGLRRMLVERLRDAALGGPRARARARRRARPSTTRVAALREAASVPRSTTERRPRRSAAAAAAALDADRRRRAAGARCSSSRELQRARRRARRRSTRRATRWSRRRSRSSPPATASCSQELLTAFAAAYAEAKDASRRSTSRISSCARATCCATTRGSASASSSASARSWSTSSRTRTGSRPSSLDLLGGGADEGALLRRRRVPVDLRLPSRRRRRLPRAPRGAPHGAAADAELPLAARGARGGQRALRRRVRRRVPAARARRRLRRVRASGRPFELLVTDKASSARRGVHWRRVRGAARRAPRRASSSTPAMRRPGEIVLLFAAGTDAEWFEEELRAVGLPTYRAAGRNYFGQQQVVDLLAYLRLLHNRYDDEALLTVLASPFVGVSNDALVLIRAEAQRQPIFRALERPLPGDLPRAIGGCCSRSGSATSACSRLAAAVPLELLCERILVRARLRPRGARPPRRASAATRTCASSRASRARTRSCAAPTSRASCASSPTRRRSARKESDAVSEEEGADAVRLLTIHAAKGLEFKVVVVADAGREPAAGRRHPLPLRRPLRVQGRPPGDGHRASAPRPTSDVKEHRDRAEQAERLRLYYVAMTRAMERLIVSGSVGAAGRRGATRRRSAGCSSRLGLEDEARNGDADRAGRGRAGRGDASSCGSTAGSPSRPPSARRCATPARGSRAGPARALRGLGRGVAAARAAAARADRGARAAAPPRRRGSRTARSRSSSAARTATTPSGSPACGRSPWGPDGGGERRACIRPRSATPCTGCSSGSTSRRRRAAATTSRRPRPRAGTRRSAEPELERVATLVARVLRLGARRAHRRARRRPGRAAVRVRARRRARSTVASTSSGATGAARSCSTTRRTSSTGACPREVVEERVPSAADRLRARVLPRRRRRGRDRLPVPRAPGRRRLRDVHAATTSPALERGARGRDRADPRGRLPADAEPVRLLGLPGARSRLRRAGALADDAPPYDRLEPDEG